MALLELIKNQKVRIGQTAAFGDIWIYQKNAPAANAVEATTDAAPEPETTAEAQERIADGTA